MVAVANLEISVRRADSGYTVELRFTHGLRNEL